MKICWETPNFFKIGQKYRAIYMKTEVRYTFADDARISLQHWIFVYCRQWNVLYNRHRRFCCVSIATIVTQTNNNVKVLRKASSSCILSLQLRWLRYSWNYLTYVFEDIGTRNAMTTVGLHIDTHVTILSNDIYCRDLFLRTIRFRKKCSNLHILTHCLLFGTILKLI